MTRLTRHHAPQKPARPWFFLTRSEWRHARKRVATEAWARRLADQSIELADAAVDVPLPEFDWSWWSPAEARTIVSKSKGERKRWFMRTSKSFNRTMSRATDLPLAAVRRLADGYLFTGDARYARRVREIIFCFQRQMRLDARSWDVGMEYGSIAMTLMRAWELCWDAFDAADAERLRRWFMKIHQVIYRNDLLWIEKEPGGPWNNHYTDHKFTMVAIEQFFGLPLSEAHIFDSPMGIREQIEIAVQDHGLWVEHSLCYQMSTLHRFIQLADLLRRVPGQTDLYTKEFANGVTLRHFIDGVISFVWPDLTVPNIGDGYGRRVSILHEELWKPVAKAYDHPAYHWLAARCGRHTMYDLLKGYTPGRQSRPGHICSRLSQEHKYAFITTIDGGRYWGSDATSVMLTRNRYGTHGHFDCMSMQMFSHGVVIADDAEGKVTRLGVLSPLLNKVNIQVISHNTVMVDGRTYPRMKRLPRTAMWREFGDVHTVIFADREGVRYRGVKELRGIAVTPEYVLDVYEVSSDTPRCYDWLFHPHADAKNFRIRQTFRAGDPGRLPGKKWFSRFRRAAVRDDWCATWRIGPTSARLTMIGAPRTTLWQCDYPGGDKDAHRSRPMLMARRRSCRTVFVAVYQAGPSLPRPPVITVVETEDAVRVTVKVGHVCRDHLIPFLATVRRGH